MGDSGTRKGNLRMGLSEACHVAGEDLVIAVLAVNQWSLEKAFALKARREEQGLFDLDSLAANDVAANRRKLERAGYCRGEYVTNLIAGRLRGLAQSLTRADRDEIVALIQRHEVDALGRLLLPLPGIGPLVLRQFLILQGCEPGERV